ncbi:uncharacterized protein LOC144933507 isoform X2 [Lampetra fluviatilis]
MHTGISWYIEWLSHGGKRRTLPRSNFALNLRERERFSVLRNLLCQHEMTKTNAYHPSARMLLLIWSMLTARLLNYLVLPHLQMEKNASDYYGSNFLSVLPRQAGWVAQGLQVQTKFHVFFRHLPRASARQLQRSLRNLPGQHLESADGALRLQLLSIDVTDVDECDVGEDLCDANAFCHNMVGSYVCFCNENYINLDPAWKGTQCQSVLAQEAPEVAALVSPLAVALGSAACILVLLVLVGVAVSSVAVKGKRRRRRLRLEANGFSCTSTPAIYFHRRWEDWDPPPAPTLSDATLVSQPRVGPPMVSASSISAPDNLASLNGGTSTGGQWRASASADV